MNKIKAYYNQVLYSCCYIECYVKFPLFTAERYCRLLKSEGGLALLEIVEAAPRTLEEVKTLAHTVIEQVLAGPEKVKAESESNPEDQSDD